MTVRPLPTPRQYVGVGTAAARSSAGASATVWTAVVRDGHLVRLDGGRSLAEAFDDLCEKAFLEPETVIGLDFAVCPPADVMDALGCRSAGEVWRWAERWMAAGADPAAAPGLPDAGLVGLPSLMRLCDVGVSVWPLSPLRLPAALHVRPLAASRALGDPSLPADPDAAAAVGAALTLHGLADRLVNLPDATALPPAGLGGWPIDHPAGQMAIPACLHPEGW